MNILKDRQRTKELREAINNAQSKPGDPTKPGDAYEFVTRQLLENLDRDMRELRGELRRLWLTAAGALLVSVALRISGL